jgi:hypothetical protein
MQKLIVLVVGAVWLAVLVPPMLRSRGEGRPNSSVDHFRRNLAILQKSAPARVNPLQSMSRPLAGNKPGLQNAYARAAMRRNPTDPRLRRSGFEQARPLEDHEGRDQSAPLQRRSEARAERPSHREATRRRREQIVRMLVTLSAGSAVLAALSKSTKLVYLCAMCVLALLGYCAMLLRLRREGGAYAAGGYAADGYRRPY